MRCCLDALTLGLKYSNNIDKSDGLTSLGPTNDPVGKALAIAMLKKAGDARYIEDVPAEASAATRTRLLCDEQASVYDSAESTECSFQTLRSVWQRDGAWREYDQTVHKDPTIVAIVVVEIIGWVKRRFGGSGSQLSYIRTD
ncbi:hypothetical protein DSL72_006692 [Monilinia vaccinii-corymbosi]|uniref:Uncharacterized protein n=1 Tax=Monilinia vaccinii-corymbosi TaxID=61207 RepID=A0A8A3PPH1_9HELO|nr:hypothetical protein DSL72_006692 [Monilinia vaccinii-corymbosi]